MSDFDLPSLANRPDQSPPSYQLEDMPSSTATLKRRASDTFEDRDDNSAKRPRDTSPQPATSSTGNQPVTISGQALADDLADELMCGCCSALLYRPVIVNPCQHYFCGSCCMLWVRNGGTSCPACRAVSSTVMPSRVLQLMVDILLRHDPSRARTERERAQADAIYKPNQAFRIPPPREASPEPMIPPAGDFVRPCPHCLPGNRHGWHCPQPVPDPITEPERAHHIDDGPPLGHTFCGNCENLLAVGAPSTSKCDFCQVSFCGISVPNRCVAALLPLQHPQGLTDVADLVQSSDVYESFNGNTVEVDYMLDYLTTRRISPRHIYRDIIEFVQSQPRKFEPLLELDIFAEVPNVAAGPEVPLDSPRNRICRPCAAEVLLWGLRDWWARERLRGNLPASITSRPDCPEGADCRQQKEQTHAREYNHIISPPGLPPPAAPASSTSAALPSLPSIIGFTSLGHLDVEEDDDDNDELTPPPAAYLGSLAADMQALRHAFDAPARAMREE